MSRKKITIELTEYEARVLRLMLGKIYVDQLIPEATHAQNLARDRIARQLFAKLSRA
jgi:hypothetical protein